MSTPINPSTVTAPLFRPFAWVAPDDRDGPYNLLAETRDLASGTALVLELVERSHLSADSGGQPLLGPDDIMRLTRMSIAAMTVIEERIDDHFDNMSATAKARSAAMKGSAR